MARALEADLIWNGAELVSGASLWVDDAGRCLGLILRSEVPSGCEIVRLPGRALLPGTVNAHSHSFQRLLRGRADRAVQRDHQTPADFWSWRDVMYAAAMPLSPEDVYDVARMAFLEMALNGTTAVGEFHYLHRAPEGEAYANPNELALQVIRAAKDVGIRINLLRSGYMRSGFGVPTDAGQKRFFETLDEYLGNTDALLASSIVDSEYVFAGIAPHSIRAVPLDALRDICVFARERNAVVHMHVSEQHAELDACIAEHGTTPVALLAREGLLSDRFTGIHAIHVSSQELDAIAAAGARICSCPTTERNLGDGIFPARDAAELNIAICFGSDSQAQIGHLGEARELEYHLRLRDEKRLRLERVSGESMSARLFGYASFAGARALGIPSGSFEKGNFADAFTVDRDHASVAGAQTDDIMSAIVFGAQNSAVRDTFVGGRAIVSDGEHAQQNEITEKYKAVARKVWR